MLRTLQYCKREASTARPSPAEPPAPLSGRRGSGGSASGGHQPSSQQPAAAAGRRGSGGSAGSAPAASGPGQYPLLAPSQLQPVPAGPYGQHPGLLPAPAPGFAIPPGVVGLPVGGAVNGSLQPPQTVALGIPVTGYPREFPCPLFPCLRVGTLVSQDPVTCHASMERWSWASCSAVQCQPCQLAQLLIMERWYSV